MSDRYDVIVVGTGHAGSEAALAPARMGKKTLVLTLNVENVAMMPCNPSIGGPAKGHLVREIDALGGEMGRNIDKTYLQVRMLNTSKGPAVQALRAQADRHMYPMAMRQALQIQENLYLQEGIVEEILVKAGKVAGVRLKTDKRILAPAVILTTGTYLESRVHIGEVNYPSGPRGQHSAHELSRCLMDLGFELARFKTGTPPRVNRRSIRFDRCTVQPGDEEPEAFSFETKRMEREQIPCYLTWTTEETHKIIEDNMGRAAMYSGAITGPGPRYCPSIEAKINMFPGKDRHQIFIEPEGRLSEEMYLGGLSTSLPEEVQVRMLNSIPGLENAEITRLGYAIEYDCLLPTQMKANLETRQIRGLFAAGQINGTTGYEEAAAQGIIAGINAALFVDGKEPFILDRSDAYIGVLIDDLVTKGTREPYRMMTSRAEYRLLLRQDNADWRLTPKGYEMGLIGSDRYRQFAAKWDAIDDERKRLADRHVGPKAEVQDVLQERGSTALRGSASLEELLRRPELSYDALAPLDRDRPSLAEGIVNQVEIQVKYEGYIAKQEEQVQRFKRMESKRLPEDLDYECISGISIEARQKLAAIRPQSLGQAARISGVSPADISVLMVHLETRRKQRAS